MIDGIHSNNIGIIGHVDDDDDDDDDDEEEEGVISRLGECCVCRKGFTVELESVLRGDLLMVSCRCCAVVVSYFYLIVSVARNKAICTEIDSISMLYEEY